MIGPMKYVNRIVRDGVEYLYLRKKGLPSIALKSPWPGEGHEAGSALEGEVKALLAALSPAKPRPGTLRGALRAYELESADYAALAQSTKVEYARLLGHLDKEFGHLPFATFTPAFILQLRDLWAENGYRNATVRLQLLHAALLPAIIAGDFPHGDPFSLIPPVRRPADKGESHRIWPANVVRLAVEKAIAEQRYGLARAIVIARYVGPRRGDLIKLAKGARQDGRFRFLSGKRKIPVDVREDPELTAWLEQIPASQPDVRRHGRKIPAGVTPMPARHLVFNLSNEPYSEDGISLELHKLIKGLHAADKIDADDYNLHGLRHTKGVEIALSGATDAEGAAMLGHASPSTFAIYRRQADRINLADGAAAKVEAFRARGVAQESAVERLQNGSAN
jgi:integrase